MENFNQLISSIEGIHSELQASAANAVNQALTLRNWLIGHYIVEFEQKGQDRAEYGRALLKSIAQDLAHIKGLDERSLRRFRQFYLFYPQVSEAIRGSLSPILEQIKNRGSHPPNLPNIPKREPTSLNSMPELYAWKKN